MILQDPKKLARLMAIQGISQRSLAKAAGWESHTFLGRLLNGKVRSLDDAPAIRIADALGVQVTDLFLPRTTNLPGRLGKTDRTGRAA